jgi:hypothetical protein
MSDPIARARRFDEREIARILERAAELQHRQPLEPTAATGLTLTELEQVAAEAGIDARHVRAAAAALDQEAPVAGALLGAPVRIELERTVDREVRPDAYGALANVIRETLASPGYASTLGKSFEWASANPQRVLRVTITPRAGLTTLRIEERFGNLVGGLFGGIVGGLGGGGGGAAIGVIGGAFGNIGLGLAAAGLALVGSFLLARTIFRSVARRRMGQLHRLLDALTEQLAPG